MQKLTADMHQRGGAMAGTHVQGKCKKCNVGYYWLKRWKTLSEMTCPDCREKLSRTTSDAPVTWYLLQPYDGELQTPTK